MDFWSLLGPLSTDGVRQYFHPLSNDEFTKLSSAAGPSYSRSSDDSLSSPSSSVQAEPHGSSASSNDLATKDTLLCERVVYAHTTSRARLRVAGAKLCKCKLYLTQARLLVLVDEKKSNAVKDKPSIVAAIRLSQIASTPRSTPGSLLGAATLAFSVWPESRGVCEACTLINDVNAVSCDACASPLRESVDIMLTFKSGSSEPLAGHLIRALQVKWWDAKRAAETGGLHGILAKREQQAHQEQHLMSDALSDLTSLMANAKRMVEIAHNIAERLENDTSSAPDQVLQFRSEMMKLGVELYADDTTTQDTSKQIYNDLVAFLHKVTNQGSSSTSARSQACNVEFISASDLYCMFNRARSATRCQVSPKELWRACVALQPPFFARTFSGGLRVIHTERFCNSALFATVKQLTSKDNTFIDSSHVAKHMAVRLDVAAILLAHCANEGVLLVDAPMKRYYANVLGTH